MEICHTTVTSTEIYIFILIFVTDPKKQPQLPAKGTASTQKSHKTLQDFRGF
jgi:hypothetical protein